MDVKKDLKQFLIYLVVGGGATIVEWICFYIFDSVAGIGYMIATALAFVFSTFANWLFGKLLLFREKLNIVTELGKIYLTSIGGLILNLIIMWIAVAKLGCPDMLAKVIATGLVFVYNFLIRKLVIYKI